MYNSLVILYITYTGWCQNDFDVHAHKVLGDGGMIDHHSDCGGFTKSPATNYMELYPFINRLWYGEGALYNETTILLR